VLFSGRIGPAGDGIPTDADLLLTVRASTLRHHAGQAAFPGGARITPRRAGRKPLLR